MLHIVMKIKVAQSYKEIVLPQAIEFQYTQLSAIQIVSSAYVIYNETKKIILSVLSIVSNDY